MNHNLSKIEHVSEVTQSIEDRCDFLLMGSANGALSITIGQNLIGSWHVYGLLDDSDFLDELFPTIWGALDIARIAIESYERTIKSAIMAYTEY